MGALLTRADINPAETLDNPMHEQFCVLVAKGATDSQAYLATHPESTLESARTNAWRLRENEGIKARIRHILSLSTEKAVLSLADKRAFLHKLVKTPVGEVDETSELAQKVRKRSKTVNGVTETETEIVICDKLVALKLDAQLAGELDAKPIQGITLHLHAIAPQAEEPVYDLEEPPIEVEAEVISEGLSGSEE